MSDRRVTVARRVAYDATFATRLADHDMGKGCLRFRDPAKIDYDLVRDLLRATAPAPGQVC